jgi:imidazolonepropionase-like amidohydrolase
VRTPTAIPRLRWLGLLAALACAAARADAPPQKAKDEAPKPRIVAVSVGHLHVGDGTAYAPGVLLLKDGVVEAAGGAEVSIPETAERWSYPEAVLTPWLVDPRVEVDLAPSEAGKPDSIMLTAADARPSFDPWLELLRGQGVGAACLVPRGASGILGRTATIVTNGPGAGGAELLGDAHALAFRLSAAAPGSAVRAAQRQVLPTMLDDAQKYRDERKKKDAEKKKSKGRAPQPRYAVGRPRGEGKDDEKERSEAKEILLEVLDGKLPLRGWADRDDDADALLVLARDRHLTLVLDGCRGCTSVAARVGESQAPVVLDPLSIPAREIDDIPDDDLVPALVRAGARVAVTGGGAWPDGPFSLRAAAALLAAEGLPHDAAIAAMTGIAGEAAGVRDRFTLSKGTPGRFLVWNGDPLDPATALVRSVEPKDVKAPPEVAP